VEKTRPIESAPALSIVIPSHNGRHFLEACLQSVFLHRPPRTEVIVVDDASQDGTSQWLRATYRETRLVELPSPSTSSGGSAWGYCRAVNAGIKASTAPIVQTLNNDTIVSKDWAGPALRLFANPAVGSVAPQVWLLREPDLLDSAGDLYYLFGWAANRGHGLPLYPEVMEEREVFGTCGGAGFFRRDALFRAGLFPQHFQAYYDDVDLAFRLRWAGYRCLYTPFSKVYHRLHGTYDHRHPEVTYLIARNEERVFRANLPGKSLRRALLPHLAHILVKVVGKGLLGRNPGAYLRGKLAVLSEVKEIRGQRQRLRLLARQASFPIRFPFENDPWMPAKLILYRLRQSLSSKEVRYVKSSQRQASVKRDGCVTEDLPHSTLATSSPKNYSELMADKIPSTEAA
jgi:GT2 family glycosyltransferase